MTLKKYQQYKNTNIQWLGQIPQHWEVKRIKDITEIISKGTTPSTEGQAFTDSGVRYVKGENINELGLVSKFPEFFISEETNTILKRSQLKNNDLLMVIAGATIGKISIVQNDILPANTNQAVSFIRLKPSEQKDSLKYKMYILGSHFIKSRIWYDVVQSAQPNLAMNVLSKFPFIYPPLSEQTAIANYLDQKTAQIDKKVTLLTQKIEKYKEFKKSLINETVCRGLDKSVSLKPSNIAWIGDIPEHWEVKRGKEVFIEKSNKGFENEPLLAASQKYGVVLKTMLDQRSMEAQKDFHNFKFVRKGDFVISLRSFEGGIEMAYYQGIISPAYSIFSGKIKIDNGFYKYFFKTSGFIQYLGRMITGIRDGQTIRYDEVNKTLFIIPPLTEQTVIAQYLDEKTNKIDQITANISQQIDTLKELRKTLINEVVTGKVRVFDN